jgi:hypothetical protein
MERQTFERALHAWDKWHNSIEQSRKLLDFDSTWPKDTCINWIEKHYPTIKKQAENELKRLELPLSLRQYWEDCFYSDYKTQDGRADYSKITRRLSEGKSLPELPSNHGVVWYEDEDIHDPWLRVEIRLHARFATKELFDYAARFAYESIKTNLRRSQVKEHPVCQWLKGGRPPADLSLALECARLKDDLGWSYKQIGVHYGWTLQKDSYGNLSQCSTARRYVKWGRELIK